MYSVLRIMKMKNVSITIMTEKSRAQLRKLLYVNKSMINVETKKQRINHNVSNFKFQVMVFCLHT